MKKALLIAGLLLVAPLAQAEGLGEFLDLSPEQRDGLRELRIELETAVAPLAREVKIREGVLAEELAAEEPDVPRVGVLVVEIQRLREAAGRIRSEARRSAVALLRADQQERLDPLRLSATLAPIARQALAANLIARGEVPGDAGIE